MGQGRSGKRRIIPIIGGTVTGPRLNGRILALGADGQTVHDTGLAMLDTRYAPETDDGATIKIINSGYPFGPPDVLAALARGETGDPRYEWVNWTMFIGTGLRHADAVTVAFYAVV